MQIKQEKIPDVTCINEKLSRLSKQGMRETTTFKYSNTDSCSVGQMYAKTYSVQSLIFTSKFTHFHKSYTQQKCLYPQINCPKSVYYYIKRTRRRINVAQTSVKYINSVGGGDKGKQKMLCWVYSIIFDTLWYECAMDIDRLKSDQHLSVQKLCEDTGIQYTW